MSRSRARVDVDAENIFSQHKTRLAEHALDADAIVSANAVHDTQAPRVVSYLAPTEQEIRDALRSQHAREVATDALSRELVKRQLEELEEREKRQAQKEMEKALADTEADEKYILERRMQHTANREALAARSFRGFAFMIQSMRNAVQVLRHGNAEARETDALAAQREHESQVKSKRFVGAQGKSLARYWLEDRTQQRFQTTAGWYLSESHHDPSGADASMLTAFFAAFVARMLYASILEALLFVTLLVLFEVLVWFVVRAAMPVLATHLDRTESLLLALVYNLVAYANGLFLAAYALAIFPHLHSFADACGTTSAVHTILWVDCTTSRTFILIAYLFVFGFLGVYRNVYCFAVLALLLCAPFMVALGIDKHEPVDVFNTFTFTSLSMAYFFMCFAAPVRGSYVWNYLLSVTWYWFAISILAGFGF